MTDTQREASRIKKLNEAKEQVLVRIADKTGIPLSKLKRQLLVHGEERRKLNDWRKSEES